MSSISDFVQDKPAWQSLVNSIYSNDTTVIQMNNQSYAVNNGEVVDSTTAVKPQVQPIEVFNKSTKRVVGFDMDDCLAFTTPAFKIGDASGFKFGTPEFWGIVNTSDQNNSVPKQGTVDIMDKHKTAGDDVYIITARMPVEADSFKTWANSTFGIDKDHIIFAPTGKVETMKEMGVSVFYGDSDSDITNARDAGATGIRVLRSEQSSYRDSKTGLLANYNPGTLGEAVMAGTTETGRQEPDTFKGATTSIEQVLNLTSIRGDINSVSDAIGFAQQQSMLSLDSAIGTGVRTIKEYTAPTMLALNSLDNIGKEFDKMIKGTFLDQMFHIKGTEMLCTAFCILVSFLPCETRKAIHKAIEDIKAAASMVTDAARTANDLIQTYNASMASAQTISQSAEGLFSGKQNIGQALFGQQATGQNVPLSASTIMAGIGQVKSTIQMLTSMLKIVAGTKITVPVGISGKIWDLASAVLFALQGMAVSMADKALSKIFNPVEEMIRKMQPQNCIGNLAAAFFNKLIDGIRRFKSWLLLLISELFTANNNWGIVYKTFGFQLKSMLELIAFLDALKLLLVHFGDLAIACGVELCEDKDSPLRDAIRAGNLIDPTVNNTPAIRINTAVPVIPSDNIDDIAKTLAPILSVPLNNIYVGPNTIQVSLPLVTNAPKKIRDLLNDPDVARELGPGYKMYTAPDNSNATVVYTFDRKCGVKE